LELPYVGSVKLDEHPDLAQISNPDTRWQPATQPGLEPTKSWRTQQAVYGQERTLVLTYNQNLFESQWATVQNDLAHALSQLAAVQFLESAGRVLSKRHSSVGSAMLIEHKPRNNASKLRRERHGSS
jgi:hypothetical protein